MSNPAESPVEVPAENVTISPRLLHAEIMNPMRGDVWLLQSPVTLDDVRDLKPEAPLIKSGATTGAMDFAYFRRSPGAQADGPLETFEAGGRRFSRVARVRSFGGFPRGDQPALIGVEKHHVLGFEAGREVNLAFLPDGKYYVEQTEPVPGRSIPLPSGWKPCTLKLRQQWVLKLPCPCDVWFFSNLRSFAGPLRPDQLPDTPHQP